MVLQGNQWSPSFCFYHHSTSSLSHFVLCLPTVVPRGTVALLTVEMAPKGKGKEKSSPSAVFTLDSLGEKNQI